MTEPITDVVVLIPGITGSTLARRQGDQLTTIWDPQPRELVRAVRTLGRSLADLRLTGDEVEPVGLVPGIHVVPGLWTVEVGYRKIVDWLYKTFHLLESGRHAIPNFVRFPYDWRLSNQRNAQLLKKTAEPVLHAWRAQGEPFQDARLVLICHSMGGLLARWYAEQLGGAEFVRAIVTIGTPHRGSVKALDYVVNGAPAVLGPIGRRLTEILREFPSVYELLPAYRCVDDGGRLLAPHETSLPNLDAERAWQAREGFHDRLHPNPTRETTGYDLHTIAGVRQPTNTTAVLTSTGLSLSSLIDGDDLGGDGTVPRLAATPPGVALDAPTVIGVAEQHGSLQHHAHTLEQLYTVLTGTRRVYLDDASAARLSVSVPEIHHMEERLSVRVQSSTDKVRLRATVHDESGAAVRSELLKRESPAAFHRSFDPLPSGGYRVVVHRDGPDSNNVSPVTAGTLVWDPQDGE